MNPWLTPQDVRSDLLFLLLSLSFSPPPALQGLFFNPHFPVRGLEVPLTPSSQRRSCCVCLLSKFGVSPAPTPCPMFFFSLKLECDKLASEKSEMQRHYVMVSLLRPRGWGWGSPDRPAPPAAAAETWPPPLGSVRIQGPPCWPGCRPRRRWSCQTAGLQPGPARSPGCPWQQAEEAGCGSQELTWGISRIPAPTIQHPSA